jgi:amidase
MTATTSVLEERSVPDLARAVRDREVRAVELVELALAAVAARDAGIGAVVHVAADRALAEAHEIDRLALADPAALGPCAGVPTLVKDLNNVAGMPTTFGTAAMARFVPPFDDEAVRRIRAAGFVVLGKTNAPEIGSLPWTDSALHGPTRNPWDRTRTAGGSSGGAAAAVAAGYVPSAHASDGAGSIRIPASCCGVVGIKPARGRVSQAPLFGDQVMGFATQGPIGRRVVDAAAMLDAMQGYALGDPTPLAPPARAFAEEVGVAPGRQRIGVVATVPWAEPDHEVREALDVATALLEGCGHDVEPLDLRLPAGLVEQFLAVWAASVAATPLHHDGLEPHNRAFAARGRAMSAADLLRASTSLQLTARAAVTACATVDAVLAPVLSTPPLPVGAYDHLTADEPGFDGLVRALAAHMGVTPLVNVTGQAAIAIPVHTSRTGLPIGVQLIGGPAGEAGLIRLAAQLEDVCRWADRRPAAAGAA